jgi:hypothetical protein
LAGIANSNLPPCKGPDKSSWNNCFGDITYVNGDHYVGEWRDGKRHGQGTLYLADPKLISSNQANPISGEKMYKGGFKNDNRHGIGVVTKINNDNFVGEWKDGWQVNSKCKNTKSAKFTYRSRVEDSDEKLMIWINGADFSSTDTMLSISDTEFITKYRNDLAEIKVNFFGKKRTYEHEVKTQLRIEEKVFEARPVGTLFANTILLGLPLIFGPGTEVDDALGCTEVISQKLIPKYEEKILTGNNKWIESYPREITLRVSGLTKEPIERAFLVEKNSISIVLSTFIDIKKTKDNLNIAIECLSCNEPVSGLVNNFKNKADTAINLTSLKKALIDEEIFITKENKRLAAERASREAAQAKANDVFGSAKSKCADLGFKVGTEGFGKCVLRLSN